MVIRRPSLFGLLRSAVGLTLSSLMALFVTACGGGGDAPVAALNPPTLAAQPAAQTVLDGATATFTVAAAASSTPLTYQWRKNGANISGANGPSINVAAPYIDNNARFAVVVSNLDGSVTSAEAVLTVTPRAPSIDAQPFGLTVQSGSPATFSAVVSGGTAPVTLQWRRNGVDIVGATATTYTIATTGIVDNAAVFTVAVVSPSGTLFSDAATLTVLTPTIAPSIHTQPSSLTAQSGSAATFSAVVSGGTAPVTFQWHRNGVDIVGATATTYTIAATSVADNASVFALAVINPSGTLLSSRATLTVTSIAPSLALHAGNMAGFGARDGTGPEARFYFPEGLATDSASNIYVTDGFNHAIRRITPAGVVTTFAGMMGQAGSSDGTGSAARFYFPKGAAIDSADNLYVADSFNCTIRRITPAGLVTTLAGTADRCGIADGTGAAAQFYGSRSVAADSAGNIYVADSYSSTIRTITPAGVVTTLAGTAYQDGYVDATGPAARFHTPSGVATDSTGNVYVADQFNQVIRKVTPAGVVTTFAGTAGQTGTTDGTGAAARFFGPIGVATDSVGNVYVVGDADGTVIRKITPAGMVTTLAGTARQHGRTDATGAAARFGNTLSVATDSAGNVYVVDFGNSNIRKITPTGVVTTLAGTAPQSGSVDATGAEARFGAPTSAATDSAGNVYVIDGNAIRKITPTSVVTTLAGTANQYGTTDGTGAAARFFTPKGIATDSAGNVYVGDQFNYTIRKITPAGVVTTFAGTAGRGGSADGTGAAASFSVIRGVATDSAGNVYVADSNSGTIRKITPAGAVTTLAGTAGQVGSADGTGAAARFQHPVGIATDNAGNVFVADSLNCTIRKITPAGVVTTLAGTADQGGSADGTGAAARFGCGGEGMQGMTSDSAGNLYVADRNAHTIRKITPAGVVTTVVGVTLRPDFLPGALPGLLGHPQGVAVHGNSLYVTLYGGVAVVQNLP